MESDPEYHLDLSQLFHHRVNITNVPRSLRRETITKMLRELHTEPTIYTQVCNDLNIKPL